MYIDHNRYQQRPSVISDSVRFVNTNSSDISDSVITDPKKVQETEAIATYLVDKFRHPAGKQFYYKVAWRLPRNTIDRLVALALEKGDSPGRYFSKCAKQAMGE